VIKAQVLVDELGSSGEIVQSLRGLKYLGFAVVGLLLTVLLGCGPY
jgi:hypothetical protein